MATTKESVMMMVEIIVQYKKGLLNLDSAMKSLEYNTELPSDICEQMLKNTVRENVTKLRPWSCDKPKRLAVLLKIPTLYKAKISNIKSG